MLRSKSTFMPDVIHSQHNKWRYGKIESFQIKFCMIDGIRWTSKKTYNIGIAAHP
ncbi:MAG: hypothetical protein OEZ01_18470 [Candidatus Heimdallarchaeota archaeon]|nr:hypothetical protein [Candidatus Heimdallarchaeota archaeon]